MRDFLSPFFILFLALVSSQANALCTAGNPNFSLVEDTPTSAFILNNDGTATHYLTGLIWDRCSLGQNWNSDTSFCDNKATLYTWGEALTGAVSANSDKFLTHTDWRLPNIKELLSITEKCGSKPAINGDVFPSTPTNLLYWSGTSYVPDLSKAWAVLFNASDDFFDKRDSVGYVRLVRGGRPFDSFDLLGATTSITLTVSPDSPVTVSDSIMLTATVTGSLPTGTVQFFNNDSVLTCDAGNQTVTAGRATCVFKGQTAGNYSFSSEYSGDDNNVLSTSDSIDYVIKTSNLTTSVELLISPDTPATEGDIITLTATVTGNSPTGIVSFLNGEAVLICGDGDQTLTAGVATCLLEKQKAGEYNFSVNYLGDDDNPSVDSESVIYVMSPVNGIVLVASPTSPAIVGDVVTLTATVTGGTSTGVVGFVEGENTLICTDKSQVLTDGVATCILENQAVGDYNFVAKYSGDFNLLFTSKELAYSIKSFVLGDSTGDGKVDILDVIKTINIVLSGGEVEFGANCDGTGFVSILDVVCTINKVLGGK